MIDETHDRVKQSRTLDQMRAALRAHLMWRADIRPLIDELLQAQDAATEEEHEKK